MSISEHTQKGLFFDRDGTLIKYKPYLHKLEDVELLPSTSEALHRARTAGYRLFLFTNQSGVGRGYFTHTDVERVHARLLELIGLGPDIFTQICVAGEHPDEPSLYRKPSPRFIQEMIARYCLQADKCWMIGDTATDWDAGRAANISVAAIRSDLLTPEAQANAEAQQVPIFSNPLQFVESLILTE